MLNGVTGQAPQETSSIPDWNDTQAQERFSTLVFDAGPAAGTPPQIPSQIAPASVGIPFLLAEAKPVAGKIRGFSLPDGSRISVYDGYNGGSLKSGGDVFLLSLPSKTLSQIGPKIGRQPPSFHVCTAKLPLDAIPYVNAFVRAIPGDKHNGIFGYERESEGGENTDHIGITIETNAKPLEITSQAKEIVRAFLKAVTLPPDVKKQLEGQILNNLDRLLTTPGINGKPLLQSKTELGAKVALQFDFVVTTDRSNILHVKNASFFVTLKGAISGSDKVSAAFIPSPWNGVRKQTVSIEVSGTVSAEYEAGKPNVPTVQGPPPFATFASANLGSPAAAYQITEQLLQGVGNVRYPDGSVDTGVALTSGTSIWSLSRVSGGKNHGHEALEAANSINYVLHVYGVLPENEYVTSTQDARDKLAVLFGRLSEKTKPKVAADLANTIGLNLGVPEIDAANAAYEADAGRSPVSAHMRGYFLHPGF